MNANLNGHGHALPVIVEPSAEEDLDLLRRIRQTVAYSERTNTKKLLVSVKVRKPDKTWFVRAHADPTYRTIAHILELDREAPYLVLLNDLPADIEKTVSRVELVTTVDADGVIFLWPVKQQRGDKRSDDNEWNATARAAALTAERRWVKMVPNHHAKAYDVYTPQVTIADPKWDELPTFTSLLTTAFRDRIIESIDHPVLKQLVGDPL